MREIVRALLALALAASAMPASAASPRRALDLTDLGAPAFTTFTIRDGLPDSILSSIAVDREGFAWAAAAGGLVRYDGRRWESDGPFSARGAVGVFTQRRDGTLWVAFDDKGIARLDGGRWVFPEGFPARDVYRLVETFDAQRQPTLWALTVGEGLLREDGGRWLPAPGADELPRAVLSLARTQQLFGAERLWVGTVNQGLWYREAEGPWRRFEAEVGNNQINDLLVTGHGGQEQLWVSTFGSGLLRIDAQGLQSWSRHSGRAPTDMFYHLVETASSDARPVVWAASRAGLLRIHGDDFQVFDQRHGLPSAAVRGLWKWRSPGGIEVLWIATESGVARAMPKGNAWQAAGLFGLQASGVYAVRLEPDERGGERLWVGSRGDGLLLREDSRWQRFGPAEGLPGDSIRVITRDPRGQLWIGMNGGGLARQLADGRFEATPVPWPESPAQAVTRILFRDYAGTEETWVATRLAGLYRLRNGEWSSIAPPGRDAGWRADGLVEQILPDGRRMLWISSSLGLLRIDGDAVDALPALAGGLAESLYGISLLRDAGRDVLWIGSNRGLVRVDVSDPLQPLRLPADLPQAPDSIVYGAQRDSHGNIYVCTNNGVQQLTPSGGAYMARVFTRRDGLPHEECNINAQLVDAHDRFWTGTLGGLAVLDPQGEVVDREAKPLHVTSVRIDDAVSEARPVVLTPPWKELVVHFALLSWRHEEGSEFRTQLLGEESGPSPWSTRNERGFERLPPGDYRLRVEARDYAGNRSTPLELPIHVRPAWWQTWPARSAFVAAILLAAWLAVRLRLRQLGRRQQELERQVAARTAALNEANARLLDMSYHDALTGLANRRRFFEALAETAAAERGPCSLLFFDVDHFKDYNDRHGHAAGDEALRTVAEALRESAPAEALVARYGGEEFTCLLPHGDLAQARAAGERIRIGVAARAVPLPGEDRPAHVTISVGIASGSLPRDDAGAIDELVRAADAALYRAKAAGRNCVSE